MATPLKRRLTQVYVEIPPSPHDLSKYQSMASTRSNHVERGSSKENALTSPRVSLKRRASLDAMHASNALMKRAKQAATNPPNAEENELNNTSNAFAYCYQCGQKRDMMASIQCTNTTPFTSGSKSKEMPLRCSTKYCKSCLKNRYREDIKNHACPSTKIVGHAEGLGYIFKCPKCRDICNCSRCRKSKGLEPTGKIPKAPRKAGSIRGAQTLIGSSRTDNPSMLVKRREIQMKEPKVNANAIRNSTQREFKIPSEFAPPKWTELRSPLELSTAEDRIYIREFMLRFGRIMKPPISKTHLEELELIGGGFRGRDEYEDMASWVSESCVRSMILGIVSLLFTDCHDAEATKSATKEIRSMGTNLSKLWNVLRSLRGTPLRSPANNGRIHLTFPDPLPPPASAIVRKTRSTRGVDNGQPSVHILCSGQMVPVLTALVDLATSTNAIREEIEAGLRNVKELGRKSKEAIRSENERWEKTRETLEKRTSGKKKNLRDIHRQRLLSIDKALEIVSSNYATRFAGLLGRDEQGRTYWTVSPGAEEVAAAHRFIASMSSEEASEASGNGKRETQGQPVITAPTQGNFKEWSWFLAVWGQPPIDPDGRKVGSTEVPDNSDEDDQGKWWAFGEADEIRKLANWLGSRNEDGTTKSDIETLSKRIMGYAELLEWRSSADRYNTVN